MKYVYAIGLLTAVATAICYLIAMGITIFCILINTPYGSTYQLGLLSYKFLSAGSVGLVILWFVMLIHHIKGEK